MGQGSADSLLLLFRQGKPTLSAQDVETVCPLPALKRPEPAFLTRKKQMT